MKGGCLHFHTILYHGKVEKLLKYLYNCWKYFIRFCVKIMFNNTNCTSLEVNVQLRNASVVLNHIWINGLTTYIHNRL